VVVVEWGAAGRALVFTTWFGPGFVHTRLTKPANPISRCFFWPPSTDKSRVIKSAYTRVRAKLSSTRSITAMINMMEKKKQRSTPLSYANSRRLIGEKHEVETGVPRGSPVAPILFTADMSGVAFDKAKTEAIFLSKRRKKPTESVWVRDYDVQYNQHATRWLGIWIDSQRAPLREDEEGPQGDALHSTPDGATRNVSGRL